ncbi:MAG: hypothetical protein JWP31_2131 [Aeromicrobium sp.]|nr:hypothetical protein [Aeromicrobium sp.]
MSTYTAIIPVKRWENAKRRLDLSSQIRGDLARAFAEDVIAAVAATPAIGRVVIVSSETDLSDVALRTGATLIGDPLDTNQDRLNASILAGAAWAAQRHDDQPVVVVPADLPCLTSEALDRLLVAVDGRAHVVPDAQGEGTALLVSSRPSLLDPAFGPGSAARHAASGHALATDVEAALRQDVDSMADLATAVTLGVGPATREVLRRHPHDLAC